MRNGTKYDPQTWNRSHFVRTHNCYDYAMNNLETKKRTSQPGRKSGNIIGNKYDFTCPNIQRLFLDDMRVSGANIVIPKNGTCPQGMRHVQLWVDPFDINIENDNYDYHWYRKDISGNWSHKPGKNNVTNLDDSGNIIRDPKFADRDYDYLNYTDFCGEYCVPYSVDVD